MADITMCVNKGCERAKDCYRVTANPSDYQSYAEFKCNEDNLWQHFYPNQPKGNSND